MNRLNLKNCTGNHDTCPVAKECRLASVFFTIVEPNEPEIQEDMDFHANFAQKCSEGTCPGQKTDLFIDALQLVLDVAKTEDS